MENLGYDKNVNQPSLLATEIAAAINDFIGSSEWEGDKPFEILLTNQTEKIAYIYEIRKWKDWISLSEQVSNNPQVIQHYLLEKKWTDRRYIDPILMKYGTSSLHELQEIFDRLKIVIEANKPRPLESSRKIIWPAKTELGQNLA